MMILEYISGPVLLNNFLSDAIIYVKRVSAFCVISMNE